MIHVQGIPLVNIYIFQSILKFRMKILSSCRLNFIRTLVLFYNFYFSLIKSEELGISIQEKWESIKKIALIRLTFLTIFLRV